MGAGTRRQLREEVRSMFVFAYDAYMEHAFPAPELAPVACAAKGFGLADVPMVTLLDTLDALAIMGNTSEFRRAVTLVERHAFAQPPAQPPAQSPAQPQQPQQQQQQRRGEVR